MVRLTFCLSFKVGMEIYIEIESQVEIVFFEP
jgi:hypothetical protein